MKIKVQVVKFKPNKEAKQQKSYEVQIHVKSIVFSSKRLEFDLI